MIANSSSYCTVVRNNFSSIECDAKNKPEVWL